MVGTACVQQHVEDGEPNALFKATLFTPLRCQGPDYCAEPSQCEPALSPPPSRVLSHRPHCKAGSQHIPIDTRRDTRSVWLCRCEDHETTPIQRTCANGKANFRLAWRARKAQIDVLAASGQEKLDRARRIPVIRDCAQFKQWTTAAVVDHRSTMQRLCIHQLLSDIALKQPIGEMHTHLARPIEIISRYMGLDLGYHPDQLHLAEFAALKACEKLYHIDLDIDARNTIIQKAQNLSRCAVEDEQELAPARKQLEFEDVGGDYVEPTTDELELTLKTMKGYSMEAEFTAADIKKLLARETEVECARHPARGRTKESYKQMLKVAEVFEDTTDLFMKQTLPVEPSTRLHFEGAFDDVLKRFQEKAAEFRDSLDGANNAEDDLPMLKRSPHPEASLFDLDDVMQGPLTVAKRLIEAASLNEDQRRPIALVAKKMQLAWEKKLAAWDHESAHFRSEVETSHANRAALLPRVGVLVRLVIVGGGGCGKSRIINQVLSPLLTCYYGAKGVMKEAGSNKASRLIGGMTMHMANGLQGNSSLLTPHLRLTPAERRRAESRYLGGAHSGFFMAVATRPHPPWSPRSQWRPFAPLVTNPQSGVVS